MITKEEVKHIAKLARLELSEKEVEKMQKDLSSILDYFDVLKKAPKVVKPVKVTKVMENELRRDVVVPRPASLANNLVQQAPQKKEGYIKVKQIL
jgi:aspartyl/glutamyl-tRNA(Asn/Gln) amidotransferase C subunit